MKAAVYRRFGGPDVVHVEQIGDLEPKPDELLIRVHASTVSAADYRSRSRDIPAGLMHPEFFRSGILPPAAAGSRNGRRRHRREDRR